ncbi:pentaheme c-type cytochrome TorC [Rhodobium gokarnense]|uniref:Cytochrome c-type protein n=1 Tax=Rhodobium gokarnense TaxID=364296 RepID=A0ABT3H8A4_9HYPH|nr:pentaheme c-type cytochrome TorC [Rhodobium gokarnense]MCW2306630.1 trimethylamine-N-oxide reductase cytochrome c-type subunit TorC [Rhodobium gokarnense]
MFGRIWRTLWRPTSKYALGAVLIVGGIGGVVFWGGFNTFMEYTNTLEFCISCHEMRDNVYAEYTETVHYKNASGVRAICSDCHVPKPWTAKLIRKVQASNELLHKVMGTIDTKEKFQEHRLEMAQRVWDTMKATDSRECRNCHSFETMDFHKQSEKASKQMQTAMKNGDTCIDCHKGIAHKMPDMTAGYLAMFKDLKAAAKANTPSADTVYTIETQPYFLTEDAAKGGGKAAGRLLAATEVSVLERDGDLLKVRVDGWQQDQVDQVIYALRGHRIFSATASKNAVDAIQRIKTEVDPDTDLTWHQVSMEGWIKSGAVIADQKKLWDYGKEMYTSSCSVCHSLPEKDHLLANQWIGSLKAMKRFIVLDTEQYRFLQKYLQFHAKDTGGAEAHG